VVVSFIGGGNLITQRKPPTCRKSLINFIIVLRYDECSFLVLLFFVIFWSEPTIVTWKRKNIKEKSRENHRPAANH
jgi:hypothetical protein